MLWPKNQCEKQLTFTLSQGDKIICERIINDLDLPITVNPSMKNVINHITKELLAILSTKEYDTTYSIGKKVHYDLLKYRNDIVDSYPDESKEIINATPEIVKQSKTTYDGEFKEWYGIPIKFAMSLRGNQVYERVIVISGYNPECNQTLEVVEVFDYCISLIKEDVKANQMSSMWESFDKIEYSLN